MLLALLFVGRIDGNYQCNPHRVASTRSSLHILHLASTHTWTLYKLGALFHSNGNMSVFGVRI